MTGFDYGMKGECCKCIYYFAGGQCKKMLEWYKKKGWSKKKIYENGDTYTHGVDTCNDFKENKMVKE